MFVVVVVVRDVCLCMGVCTPVHVPAESRRRREKLWNVSYRWLQPDMAKLSFQPLWWDIL